MSFISRLPNIRRNGPLTDAEVAALAPSVFAERRHDSRSEKYTYIPTSAVVAGLREQGFVPVAAKQGNSRIEGKAEFTKHMVRFRMADQVERQSVRAMLLNEVFPEVVLVNSHDGTSAYHLMGGLFRLVCLNGMVVSDRSLSSVRVPHKGDVVGQVIEGTFEVMGESIKAIEAAEAWQGATLSRDEQMAMADAARTIRFADSEGNVETPITAEALLGTRRRDDAGDDLWRVFNRLQENAIKGGLSARVVDANGRRRNMTTRAVKAIDQDVRLNKALWTLGERMAEIKGVATALVAA